MTLASRLVYDEIRILQRSSWAGVTLVTQPLKLFRGLPLERLGMVAVMASNDDGSRKSCNGRPAKHQLFPIK
jgi:hypothetical protein